MTAVMVKHTGESKGYWFEAPNSLADKIQPGTHVICDTAIGQQRGKVIGTLISNGEDEAKEIMTSAGAKFPLRKVTAVECHVPIEEIKVCLQDDYKLFAINADYRPQNKSNSWYYVVAKNSKAAREKFKTRITWLNVYAVKEVLDHAEMNSVILQPLNHIIL